METLFHKAQIYVGNVGEDYVTVGQLQLELLKMNGCQPTSHVLEVGCGCLVGGRPIMQYLMPDRYVGIEPNTWLLEAVKEGLPDTVTLIEERRPLFLEVTDFDASSTGRKFDFVISHSILSHAAYWQYPQFLGAMKRILAPRGVVLASIRFHTDDNKIASDSRTQEWVYPDVSFFSWETARDLAIEHAFLPEWRSDYRELFIQRAPSNHHDWLRLTHLFTHSSVSS
jgi:cyclopropane fatty-acyl-phospholipid synthase-like methyltransferase